MVSAESTCKLTVLSWCANQVVHGAVRPEHVMLKSGQPHHQGSVALVGFGSAHRLGQDGMALQDLDMPGPAQAFNCIAPEQLAGEARPASDMFGLGATLLYLLTGD